MPSHYRSSFSLHDARPISGKGVAACQAGVDSATHQNQTLVFEELQRGTDPARIIEMLSQDPGFQGRQYGIVDLQGRMAGHSGLDRKSTRLNSSHANISYAVTLSLLFFPTRRSSDLGEGRGGVPGRRGFGDASESDAGVRRAAARDGSGADYRDA